MFLKVSYVILDLCMPCDLMHIVMVSSTGKHSHLCFQVSPTKSYLPRYCCLFEQIKHYLCYWPSQVLLNAELGKVKSYTFQVIKIVPIPLVDKDTRMMISTSPWNSVCVSVCCILAASLTVVTRAGVPHWPGVPALQRSHRVQYSTVQYSTVHCQVSPHWRGQPAPGHLQTPGYGTKWRSTGGGRRHF